MGRLHRPYYRICVMDSRTPRDGRAIEELGTYDPMVRKTDERVSLKADRVDYWLSVGALPTEKVKVLIDKFKGKAPDIRRDQPRQISAPGEAPVIVRAKPKEEPAPAAEGEEAQAPAEAAAEATE
jgi:small subunit ribosomal protein S16